MEVDPFDEILAATLSYESTLRETIENDGGVRAFQAIAARVKHQDAALRACIQRVEAGLHGFRIRATRPLATLMLVGPTGVGKTETAKALAEHYFGSENALIRFDMSEFGAEWAEAGLIGAKPGYIGHGHNPGLLTARIRARPRSVVLFDEIEKAHPTVCDLLLQVLDNGRLTDAQGIGASFRESIVVFTSNCGASKRDIGFFQNATRVTANIREALTRTFRPEFLGRVGEPIVFEPLTTEALRNIARYEIDRVLEAQLEKGYDLRVGNDVIGALVRRSNPNLGARSVHYEVELFLADAVSYLEPDTRTYQASVCESGANEHITWEPIRNEELVCGQVTTALSVSEV